MKRKLDKEHKIRSIADDLKEGTDKLSKLTQPTVMVYGSARLSRDVAPVTYADVHNITKGLARQGIGTMTGGGPGLMSAANEGAIAGGGESSAVSLEIRSELHDSVVPEEFDHVANHFFTRKVIQVDNCDAFLVVPGGVGTMDELFEVITLILTERMVKRPVVVYNRAGFYDPLMILLESFIANGTLGAEARKLVSFCTTKRGVLKLLTNKLLHEKS